MELTNEAIEAFKSGRLACIDWNLSSKVDTLHLNNPYPKDAPQYKYYNRGWHYQQNHFDRANATSREINNVEVNVKWVLGSFISLSAFTAAMYYIA